MKNKEKIILAAALVVPGGLAALGIWKAYELLKGKKNEKNIKLSNDVNFDDFRGAAEFSGGEGPSTVRGQQHSENVKERKDPKV